MPRYTRTSNGFAKKIGDTMYLRRSFLRSMKKIKGAEGSVYLYIYMTDGDIVTKEISEYTGYSIKRVNKALAFLSEIGYINRVSNKAKKKKVRGGYVYLIKANKYYKIGMTSRTPEKRIREFSPKLPFKVKTIHIIKTDNAFGVESELHKKFSEKRLNNSEWFLLSKSDVKYIKGIR